jgi:hypothetical protein
LNREEAVLEAFLSEKNLDMEKMLNLEMEKLVAAQVRDSLFSIS